MFRVVVSRKSAVPPYEQLRRAVIKQVRAGDLIAGTKIPTVRGLASKIGLGPGTVARAYRALEHEGVLETRGRQGSFIASTGDPTRDRAGRAANDYVAAIRGLGLSDNDARTFLDAAVGTKKAARSHAR